MLQFIFGVLTSYTILFCVQLYSRSTVASSLSKGESNYFSTLSRIQQAAKKPCDLLLVGSSITGRLPGREMGNDKVGNLGVDGGNTMVGLQVITHMKVECPRLLVCEVNTILGYSDEEDNSILQAVKSNWFNCGKYTMHLEYSSRPSFMLYGSILNNFRSPNNISNKKFNVEYSPNVMSKSDYSFSEADAKVVNKVCTSLNSLKKSGYTVLLVRYPAGIVNDEEYARVNAASANISQATNTPYIDLEKNIPRNLLEFSDNVHLSPTSAKQLLDLLYQYMINYEIQDNN